ncbi:hypothetical protein HY008_02745 [Candidatus Woesebacteria bacterium]|nr:hypothetical protein [Candidatus Woesebacteria bacterium]
MSWKEFLKPNKAKILIFFLFPMALSITIGALELSTMENSSSLISSLTNSVLVIVELYLLILFFPAILVFFKSFNSFLELLFPPAGIISWYILSCLLVWLFRQFFSKHDKLKTI